MKQIYNVQFEDITDFNEWIDVVETITECTVSKEMLLDGGHTLPIINDSEAGTVTLKGLDYWALLRKQNPVTATTINISGPLTDILVDTLIERSQPMSTEEEEHQLNSELHPDLWKNGKLDSQVLKTLKSNADEFMKFVDLPELQIVDVVITGSSANYNWTEHSDIDLHIIVDAEKAEKEYGPVIFNLFDVKRRLWNLLRNNQIHDMDVELYIERDDEEHISTGVYSIKNSEWVIKPTQFTEADREHTTKISTEVTRKVSEYTKMIEDGINENMTRQSLESILQKLIKARRAGLSKRGELSVENITFKALRNNGVIDKLHDKINELTDKELSVNVEDEEIAFIFQ